MLNRGNIVASSEREKRKVKNLCTQKPFETIRLSRGCVGAGSRKAWMWSCTLFRTIYINMTLFHCFPTQHSPYIQYYDVFISIHVLWFTCKSTKHKIKIHFFSFIEFLQSFGAVDMPREQENASLSLLKFRNSITDLSLIYDRMWNFSYKRFVIFERLPET